MRTTKEDGKGGRKKYLGKEKEGVREKERKREKQRTTAFHLLLP